MRTYKRKHYWCFFNAHVPSAIVSDHVSIGRAGIETVQEDNQYPTYWEDAKG